MADITNLSQFLTDVAESIRIKRETTEQIPAANFDTEIMKITTGVMTQDEYDECEYVANNILGITDLPETLDGAILQLSASQNTGFVYDPSISYWTNMVTGERIPVSNFGWKDEALVFNGSNTEFNSGIAQSELSDGYTIALRILPERWGSNNGVFGLHYNDYTGIDGLQYYGSVKYEHFNNGTINIGTDVLSLNNWHTVLIKYNSETHLVQLYVDKALVGSRTMSLKPNGNIIVGRSGNLTSADRYFKGNMSHFIIYNKMLSDTEVEQLYKYIENT